MWQLAKPAAQLAIVLACLACSSARAIVPFIPPTIEACIEFESGMPALSDAVRSTLAETASLLRSTSGALEWMSIQIDLHEKSEQSLNLALLREQTLLSELRPVVVEFRPSHWYTSIFARGLNPGESPGCVAKLRTQFLGAPDVPQCKGRGSCVVTCSATGCS